LSPDFPKLFTHPDGRRKEKLRSRLPVFLACLGVSAFLWILVQIAEDYYYSVEYPLVYSEVPARYQLVQGNDSLLLLKVKAEGFNWFSEQFLKPSNPFELRLRHYKPVRSGDAYRIIIPSSNLSGEIASQCKLSGKLISVFPDTIYVNLKRKNN